MDRILHGVRALFGKRYDRGMLIEMLGTPDLSKTNAYEIYPEMYIFVPTLENPVRVGADFSLRRGIRYRIDFRHEKSPYLNLSFAHRDPFTHNIPLSSGLPEEVLSQIRAKGKLITALDLAQPAAYISQPKVEGRSKRLADSTFYFPEASRKNIREALREFAKRKLKLMHRGEVINLINLEGEGESAIVDGLFSPNVLSTDAGSGSYFLCRPFFRDTENRVLAA